MHHPNVDNLCTYACTCLTLNTRKFLLTVFFKSKFKSKLDKNNVMTNKHDNNMTNLTLHNVKGKTYFQLIMDLTLQKGIFQKPTTLNHEKKLNVWNSHLKWVIYIVTPTIKLLKWTKTKCKVIDSTFYIILQFVDHS